MRRPALIALSLVLAVGASPAAEPPPMTLGVTTHFGQGWPERYWALLAGLPAPIVRDAVGWRKIEAVPGTFVFSADTIGHIDRLCGLGRRVLLVLEPRHPLYDGGLTVYSAAAVASFARYTKAVADRFGSCIAAFEIGNEINVRNNMTGAAASARPAAHTAILRAVSGALKPRYPEIVILGGSTNSVPTGFVDRLLAAGAGDHADAITVHPYRKDPANLDWELQRLAAKMAARDGDAGIWATEFSRDFARSEEAPAFLLKMAALMSAAGVEHADWYALADQPGFPTMGLFDRHGAPKPAAAAFVYTARELLPKGRGERLNPEQTDVTHIRFGAARQVLWGGRRPFTVSGAAVFRDAAGEVIAKPAAIGDEPFVVEGDVEIVLGPRNVLADSLYDYARAPWRYLGQRATAPVRNLAPIDWQWASYLGSPLLQPLAVNPLGIVAGATAARPLTLTLRYTAPVARRVHASACLSKPVTKGGLIPFVLRHGSETLHSAQLGDNIRFGVPVEVEAGDAVDFVLGPMTRSTAGAVLYRLRIAATSADAADC